MKLVQERTNQPIILKSGIRPDLDKQKIMIVTEDHSNESPAETTNEARAVKNKTVQPPKIKR